MKSRPLISRLLLAVLPLLLLVACTGTMSLQAPRLLVVTYASDTDGLVALVRDNGPSNERIPPRLEFLAETATPLAGRAVAADLTNRAGARKELVLLIERGAAQYALAFFNTDNLNPLDPVRFERSSDDLELTPLLAEVAVDIDAFCLTALQVSHDARFVALLNGGGSCPAEVSDAPELFILDLEEGSAASISKTRDLLPVRPYLQQGYSTGSEDSRLFYLVGSTGESAQLWSTPLPLPSVGGSTADGTPGGTFSGGSSYRDLAPSVAGMLALRSDSVNILPPEGSTSKPLTTKPAAVQFVRDPYGDELTQILVLHDGPQAGLSVHRTDTDASPANARASDATSATVDSERLYAYLLQPGQISIVDLYDVIDDPSNKLLRPGIFRFDELADVTPGLITWVPAALPAQ